MKSILRLIALFLSLSFSIPLFAQTSPNLLNGMPPQGSYDGSTADTVNLMNGNLTLHIPLPITTPQRGQLAINYYLVLNAKTWFAQGDPNTLTGQWYPASPCSITSTDPPSSGPCGQGPVFVSTASFGLTRSYGEVFTEGVGTDYSVSTPTALVTWDGSGHSLVKNSTTASLITYDGSGYQVIITGSNGLGLPYDVVVIDRNGVRYSGGFVHDQGTCSTSTGTGLTGSTRSTTCTEHFVVSQVIDANGNVLSPPIGVPTLSLPMWNGPTLSTQEAVGTEADGCLTSFGTPWVAYLTYPAPSGQTNQIKLCFAVYPQLATSFSPSGIHQFQDDYSGHPFPGNYRQPVYLSNVILPDNTQWSINYDSYGEITSVITPTGASIQYSWAEAHFPVSSSSDITSVSRAVATRTVHDVNSDTFKWTYNWGVPGSDGTMTHTVTDPNGNDVIHVFSPVQAQPTAYPYNFKETSTQRYQGTGASRTLLETVDTTWQIIADAIYGVATDVKTTRHPSNEVALVHRDYVSTSPSFELPISEKDYDWGSGTPGALLRELDTVYQWQKDSNYLKANMLALPASVITVSPVAGSNAKSSCPADATGTLKFCMAETDYTYDETNYLTSYEGTVGTLPTGTHLAAPAAVRGNLTSVSKWLSTGALVVSHTNWYDTGEPHIQSDPLGHTTTISYGPVYNGALPTMTCNAKSQCVSATYDVNTGLITSFSDENASFPASGTSQGDPAHTTRYSYDSMRRIKTAVSPPDSSGQAQTSFDYLDPTTVKRLQSITSALTDTLTTHLDGLGHATETDHLTPDGTVIVHTDYDGLGQAASVTNPYLTTADATYGTVQTAYDGLGRPASITEQDGSVKTADYSSGNCVTSFDEAGKPRKTCSDALGRLVEVDEPGDLFKSTGGISIGGAPVSEGTQPIVAGSSLTSFSDSFGEHLLSIGSDQHVYQAYWNGSSWANQDLTALSGGALAIPGSPLTSYTIDLSPWNLGQNENVFFLCANQHICSLWWTSTTGNWVYQDITAAIGGVAAAVGSTLASTATDLSSAGQGKAEFVYYLGANQHVYQLWWNTNTWTWQNHDLTALANAAIATAGSPLSSYATDLSSAGLGLNTFVFYIGTNQHVYQLWWNTVNWAWESADLTTLSNGASAASGSKLTGFSIDLSAAQLGMNQLAFYTGANQHIYALWWSTSNFTWQNQDLTAMTSCPLALTTGALTSFSDGASEHVYFVGADQHMNELVWSTGTWSWNQKDLTAGTNSNVVASGSGLTGFVDSSGEHVFDVGNDLLLDQVSFSNGAWRTSNPGLLYVTLYTYDALGNLVRVDQKGSTPGDSTQWRTRTFTYDSLGRLLTAHNPESGTITYSYDLDGNLLQKTSPAPNQTGTATQTISYCYDELNRVTGKAYSAQSCPLASPAVTYSYDVGPNAKGHLTGVTDQAGSASYSYDVLGRLASETRVINGIAKSLSYDYNLDGSIAALHYPSGRVVTYVPDSAGRITSITDSNGTPYASSLTYWPNGTEHEWYLPDIYLRTDLNQRLQISGFYSDNGQISSFFMNKTYSYGPAHQDNGNIMSIINNKDSTRTQTYTYDSLNRITSGWSAAGSGTLSWGENYTMDAWGNLTMSPMSGKTHGGTFQHAGDANNHASGLGYDAAGNLTNYSAPNQYVYDPENRIQTTAGTTYTYDSDGNRVKKTNGSTGTLYWYGLPGTMAESDLSGNLKSEYIFVNGKRAARIDLANSSVHYYLSDHLNSTSMVISSAGVVEDESDYSAFGTEYPLISSGANHYKFTGKERDSESQLDYFGARYYSNVFGRFLTPDWSKTPIPIPYADLNDPQTFNQYSYVRNVPTTTIDQDGHDFWHKLKNWWTNGGWTEDDKQAQEERQRRFHERANEARATLSHMKNFTMGGKTPAQFAKDATDQEAIDGLAAATNFIFAKPRGPVDLEHRVESSSQLACRKLVSATT
ncbi:MAG TPA: RHS repeat-associated core domain-containing protein [Candidatus Angelobacter sp.]|nr:RHS repeat-associated core domain-containing protein [Candidatus Angelobacter sp.]